MSIFTYCKKCAAFTDFDCSEHKSMKDIQVARCQVCETTYIKEWKETSEEIFLKETIDGYKYSFRKFPKNRR